LLNVSLKKLSDKS